MTSMLLLLLTAGGLSAKQQTGSRGILLPGPQSGPRVTITSPSVQPTLTVESSKLTLAGRADPEKAAAVRTVSWSNNRGGSGTAVYDPGSRMWTTASGGAPTAAVHDNFTGTPGVRLDSPSGESGWEEAVSTIASKVAFVQRAGGYVQINKSSDNGRMPYIINTVEPFPGSLETSYDVSVTLSDVSSGADDSAALIFGYQDEANYCAVFWYGAGAATDLYLLKRSNGALAMLGDPTNVDPTAGDVLSIEVRGDDLDVKVNDVSRITAVDTECDDADGVGLGVGALRGVATDDAVSAWQFDDFIVNAAPASDGAITLQPGANVITVTATDTAGRASTDVITVILSAPGADTQPPSLGFTAPTSSASHSTTSATVDLGVSASDNAAVTSCTFTCSTCVPASGAFRPGIIRGTWSARGVILPEGSNVIVATCFDASENEASDTLTVTRRSAGSSDTPPPPIVKPPPPIVKPPIPVEPPAPVESSAPTITVPGSFTSSTSPARITGSARDNVSVARVRWTCDRCPSGSAAVTPGPSVSWAATVTLVPGVNVVTFIAEDDGGNRSSDSVTVTYHAKLTITTVTLGPAKQGIGYGPSGTGVTLSAAGASGPFTWDNNAGGTSLGEGACRGLSISSTGVVRGTPTTKGTCTFVVKVRDKAGATDTRAFSLLVRDPSAAGAHDYYEDLIARGDCYKAYSWRPIAGHGKPVASGGGVADCANGYHVNQLKKNPWITYNPDADTDPQKVDAAKVRIPVWAPPSAASLAAPMNATQTTFTYTGSAAFENERYFLIDDEIMSQVTRVGNTVTVERGLYGTKRAPHAAGSVLRLNTNSLITQNRPAVNTDGSITARYLFTWDAYYTGSYVGAELQNHKAFMISSLGSGDQWWETQTRFSGPTEAYMRQPSWNENTDVAVVTARRYGPTTPPALVVPSDGNPAGPIANGGVVPIIKPGKWVRFWVEVEANAESDDSKFVTVTKLAAPIGDPRSTVISIDHPSAALAGSPFSAPSVSAGASWPGRVLRIGSEQMTIVSADTSGETRHITVVRGANGTKPTTHAKGAGVQVINDYVSMWVATEDTAPVQVYDRHPMFLPINHKSATARGSMNVFWVEFNTSTQQLPRGRADGRDGVLGTADDFEDLVSYVRNLVILKDPPKDWSSLRVKPLR